MKLLGCDPGLATFGAVLLDCSYGQRCVRAGVFTSEPLGKKLDVALADDRVRRCRELRRWLAPLIDQADAVAAEAMSFPRGAKAIAAIALAWGVLVSEVERRSLPMVAAHPKTWRRALDRRGTEDTAHDAAMELVPTYLELQPSIAMRERVHARDALGVACWSLQTDVVRSMLFRLPAPGAVVSA